MSIGGRLLKVKEAASILNVDRRTIWRWIKKGRIQAIRLPSGRYRIPEGEVVKILREGLEKGGRRRSKGDL